MKIIIKFVLKNMKEKKFRTFLIVFSIILSSALFFASMAISNTMEEMYMERIKQYYGTSDIIMYAGEHAPSQFFRESIAKDHSSRMEYMVGSVETSGIYKPHRNETVRISLKGFRLKDLEVFNPVVLSKDLRDDSFSGKKLILSRIMADKYELKVGEFVEMEVGGISRKFEIAALAEPVGPFQEDGQSNMVIVPLDTLNSMQNARGKVSILYMKLLEEESLQENIGRLSQDFKRYIIREPISIVELQQQISMITSPFLMMTTMVLFMSVLIIYTSFKVITMERLPIIGTFRSIGATRKMTDAVLIYESLMYGVIGGLLGCGLGLGFLYLMGYILSEDPQSGIRMDITMAFSYGQLIGAFLLAVILALVSSLIPIIKVSKIPVKDIVLGQFEAKTKKKAWKLRWGLGFLIFSLIAPWFTPRSLGLLVGGVCLILVGTAISFLIPYITKGFIKIFERVYSYIFGNEGIMAAKNLRENKSILNNISLLSVGISSLLLVNTISFSVVTEVTSFYNDAEFEIMMYLPQASRSTDQLIRTVDGVEDVYGIFGIQNTELPELNDRINLIHGVDKKKYLDYWRLDLDEELLEQLDQGRNILLSKILKDRFNVEAGDVLSLKLEKGEKDYKVVGFFNSMRWNGNYALISDRYYKLDTGNIYYDEIYVNTHKEPNEVKNNIKLKFARNGPWVETVEQMEIVNQKSNEQLFVILQGFSIMTMAIGIFGVMNNLVISFLERRRYLAIFRSVGMSKKQIIKMIFIEAFTGGVIGGSVGVMTGIFMIFIMPNIMTAMNTPIPLHYSGELFLYSMLAGIIIMVVASISPALRTSKLNIVESIKYE